MRGLDCVWQRGVPLSNSDLKAAQTEVAHLRSLVARLNATLSRARELGFVEGEEGREGEGGLPTPASAAEEEFPTLERSAVEDLLGGSEEKVTPLEGLGLDLEAILTTTTTSFEGSPLALPAPLSYPLHQQQHPVGYPSPPYSPPYPHMLPFLFQYSYPPPPPTSMGNYYYPSPVNYQQLVGHGGDGSELVGSWVATTSTG